MSSTPYGTGFGDSTKPSSKVLRPPGGGTSDIFGSEAQAQTPRAVKNHMQSNIFGNNDQRNVKNNGDSVRRSQKNVDSYSRLFGEPERPFTPAKNHMKSNIPIGPTAAAAAAAAAASEAKETNGSSSSSLSSSSTAALAAPPVANNYQNRNRIENGGSDHQNGVSKTDGNPVTGEGYKPAGAEINTSVPALNGANQVIIKNRIPPGGYSSGLW